MKSEWLKNIGIIIFIIILFFILYKVLTYKEPTFSEFPFQSNHYIFNKTEMLFLDTIINAGLQKLKIDSVIITIRNLENIPYVEKDLDIKSHIIGKGYQYLIYIEKCSRRECIKILSHELIHLKQYYNNELINDNILIWKDDTININEYRYNDRPWEKEAFEKSDILEKEMKELLYL